MDRLNMIIFGMVLGAEISLLLDFIRGEINLPTLLANFGLASLVILLGWKVLPKIKAWSERL